MAVSSRHILHQGPVLGAVARALTGAGRPKKGETTQATIPSPEIVSRIAPLPAQLVADYVRHVGGDPSAYRGRLPAHLFPQWAMAVQFQTLTGVSYPLAKILNGGCRMELRAPLPQGEPLEVRGQLVDIDDDGRRAILHFRLTTGTKSVPDALVADTYGVVLLGGKGDGKSKSDRPRVPETAREIAYERISARAGLDFAKLTGDFNPIHWVPAYARASGFPNVILHGFSTMARAYEAVVRNVFAGNVNAIRAFDVRFTRPLVLPAHIGFYVDGDKVYVGDAPGGPAYLVGTFEPQRSHS